MRRPDLSLLAITTACLCVLLLGTPAHAEDWPHWRGPDRNGIASAEGFDPAFGRGGEVDQLWSVDLGVGFTGVSVADGRAFTAGYRDGHTVFYCFDAETGQEQWAHQFRTPIYDNLNVGGPSGSPAIDGERVYHQARNGVIKCYEVEDGEILWERDLAEDYGVDVPRWGFSGSPVIIGDVLYLDIGRIVALNKANGQEVWATDDLGPAYSTPAPFTHDGTDYLAVFPRTGLHIINRSNGRRVAHHGWTTEYGVNAATPVIVDGEIFISSDYNTGCALLSFDGRSLDLQWENRNLKNQMCTSVLHEGHLYGFNSNNLVCIDAATGERLWSQRGLGRGTVILAENMLVVLSDQGEVLTAPATPDGFEPITRARVVQDRTLWTAPTLSNGRLYVRASSGELVCIDVSP